MGDIGETEAPVATRAIVYDSFSLFLDVISRLLTARGIEVRAATTESGRLVELIEEHSPELLLVGLDATPNGTDVAGLVRAAVACQPDLKVIALAKRRDDDRVEEFLAAGASAYVANDASAEDMEAAIRQSLRQSIHLAADRSPPRLRAVGLTNREEEVLKLVAEGHTNAEMARLLWLTPQTVKFHLGNIYRKLNVANRTQASRWAQRNGLGPSRLQPAETAAGGR